VENKITPALEMKNITKIFGDFVANDNLNLVVQKGEVHALLGENGAGKTTLMNILYGLYTPTSGDIFINGVKTIISNPKIAIEHRIGMVHQHFMLVKPFTVTENIILGKEKKNKFGKLLTNESKNDIIKISKKYSLYVNPDDKISDITVGMQQRVEILKALYRGADILILDEPTAVLTPQEIQELGIILKNLTNEGKSIIFISHKLKEITQFADRCTIIRRGKLIDTIDVKNVTEKELASKMVGRNVNFKIEKNYSNAKNPILKINNLVVKNNMDLIVVNKLSLEVKAGEILGIAGIDGNGQTELVEAITGLRHVESGEFFINNKNLTNKSPLEIFQNKVAHIPEDRQKFGLIMDFSIKENLILQTHASPQFSKNGLLNPININFFADKLIGKFDVRPTDKNKKARDLSGGNQQKVIIAREVTHDPQLLIAVQPTRGLDVGAIEFVHKSLIKQRDEGKAVLLLSLELDEVMNVSDRIAVIFEGEIVGIVDAKKADVNELGLMMSGGKSKK
jgi:simple sugar transport system ATP-binding protein